MRRSAPPSPRRSASAVSRVRANRRRRNRRFSAPFSCCPSRRHLRRLLRHTAKGPGDDPAVPTTALSFPTNGRAGELTSTGASGLPARAVAPRVAERELEIHVSGGGGCYRSPHTARRL